MHYYNHQTSLYFEQFAHETEFKPTESWVVLSPIEKQIKEKIEAIGTPLKEWDININYGIKTGFNEAFIISGEKRKELIEQDPKSDEIIRPLLRGRDIKRYSYEFADLYLLFIPWHFPLHNNPNITGASLEAEKEFENQYPAIYNHLLNYKKELSNRNKAETGIRYEWYALQRWGANYWEDFSKQKIVYNDIAQKLTFAFAEENIFFNNTVYFINGNENELKYLIGFLNSSLIDWYYKTQSVQLGEKAVRLFSIYVEKIPIIKFDQQNGVIELSDSMLSNLNNSKEKEIELNRLIYNLYDLTNEEIEFIEAQ